MECASSRRWRGKLLACSCKPLLSISKLLTSGLKPSLQLGNLSVARRQIVRCSRKLCLEFCPLLCRLRLDLCLLPCKPIPLYARIGQLRLSGGLSLSGLLQAALGLRQLVLEL